MSEPFLGEIRIVALDYAPRGWARCDGQLLPINQNQALFSLLGTTYGGDGRVTFALPDLRGRVPLHRSPDFVLGQAGGQEAVTLIGPQMPEHVHAMGAATDEASAREPGLPAQARVPTYARPAPGAAVPLNGALGSVGGGQPHENVGPSLVLNFIIALQGIFPSRN